ncbi:sulfatase-like hydrolase/transferase, partial [Akkermansiaceae bacterium]|nr:sulfatase-like hydrolase/transferase [Akkermansiaceae bacterium]
LADHPMDRGFDHFFGFLNGFTDHFAGSASYRLDRKPFNDFGPDYYSSDAFADRAIDFVSKKSVQPFFLYLSFQAPHNPLQAPKADILRHRGKYLGGWQATREARFARQKKLGLFPQDAALPPYPKNLPDWNTLSDEQKDLEDLRMATYAAMIERMDQGIGRLIEALKKTGQLDNTLILFLSDNGTDPFSVVDQAMLKRGLLPGDPGSNYQPGNGWAYASVTPWRLYKISQHGGGITTGAIAHWPKGIQKKGRIVHTPLHVIDIMPAFPNDLSFLNGEPIQRKTPLYFQYMDNRAIRNDQWTLAAADGGKWELFDTQKDPLEVNDLADKHPAVVAQLDQNWSQWWQNESGKNYRPKTTKNHRDYKPQGDRGTGQDYQPSAMPKKLSKRYPLPSKSL